MWGDDLIEDIHESLEDEWRNQGKGPGDWRDTHETIIVEHKYIEIDDPPTSSRNYEDKRGINPVR